MEKGFEVDDIILNYNPEQPQTHFKKAGVAGALIDNASERLPVTVPWPAHAVPKPVPLDPAPKQTDDLSRFAGYDAVVVTWTAAEGAALASLFTPGYPTLNWYEYRHDVKSYIPLVTGVNSPFNATEPEYERYYHSLGLYFPCKIGNAKVLLFKSGLHLDYDGPATPVNKLMTELVQTIKPKVFITTGTGGAIGKDVLLSDAIVAAQVKFDCTTQFKNETWKTAEYPTTPVTQDILHAITPALTKVNAARVPNARKEPKIWADSSSIIVTTDFFGFDDSTDYYHLQGLGRVCDMGDAMVAQAVSKFPGLKWFAIRNASDPQIPNPDKDIKAAKKQSGDIYSKYGAITSATSIIATWAVIDALINKT